ncbi:MAG: hypothetical protein ABI675_12520 [Chitinophagaceae bacterium]
MNKKLTVEMLSFLLITMMLGMTACVKNTCKQKHTYTYFEPVYKTKTEVKANIKSNPARQLENTGKIYILGNFIFLNEIDKGIHVIDNTNPSAPKNIAFIDIPGNVDMAVKGNMLYADMYTDLVAIDITDPNNVKEKKVVDGIFPERYWGGGFVANRNAMVVDWVKKEMTVTENCEEGDAVFNGRADIFYSAAPSNSAGAAKSPVGVGGSMARFTIVNDYLYAVNSHDLLSISLVNAADPVVKEDIAAGFDIQTIYPFEDYLFLGSMGGMYIFDISNPAKPVAKSNFVHATACDPVISDGEYAYVTLRKGTNCGPAADELLVIDVRDLLSPSLVKTYSMTSPHGLSKDGDLLFICDGKDGLKTYDASDVRNLRLIKTIDGMETYDVIAMNKVALVVAKDGLYQYSYADLANIRLLSKITINK